MRSVHLQVIDDALVDHLRLRHGHPADPIPPGKLAACGDRAVAPDGDPQYVLYGKSLLPPLLGYRSAEEDRIDDDPGARTGCRGDPVHPRRFQPPESWPDTHAAIRGELDACLRCWHGGRHGLDQHVVPYGKPRIRQDRLQAPDNPGFARTGSAIQHDHLSCHGATVEAFLTIS
jgi:hypothetical protein